MPAGAVPRALGENSFNADERCKRPGRRPSGLHMSSFFTRWLAAVNLSTAASAVGGICGRLDELRAYELGLAALAHTTRAPLALATPPGYPFQKLPESRTAMAVPCLLFGR
jgi:hypothetical protein